MSIVDKLGGSTAPTTVPTGVGTIMGAKLRKREQSYEKGG